MKELIQLTYYSLFECNFYKLPSIFPLKHFCNYLPIFVIILLHLVLFQSIYYSLFEGHIYELSVIIYR